MLDITLADYPGIEQLSDDFYHEQVDTGNKNQVLSAKLHLLVQYFKSQQPDLTFIHHYYFDGVAFPGQKSKFSFRDAALSAQWLDDPDLHFISGHLHQAFAYKNYLCTGSIRATSPLEENQLKGFFSLREGRLAFYESGINFYFLLDREQQASSLFDVATKVFVADDVQDHHRKLEDAFKKNLSGLQEVEYHFLSMVDLKTVVLSLRVDELNYQKMDSFITPELQIQLSDVKLKKQQVAVDDLLEKLQKPDAVSLKGFGGWIDLLRSFLKRQYPENYQDYEKLLHDLELV